MTTQLPTPSSGSTASPTSRHSQDSGGDETPTDRVPAGPTDRDRNPAAPEAQRGAPGTIIGSRYTLRTAIGHGGMGTVWRASDTLLRRDVAVKEVLLPQGMAASDRDAMYQRTLREARAAAALSHPAVVQVYDVVTEGGRPWIVMELLQARSLAEIIVEDGPLAARAVAKIGIALLGALEVAHAAGVLHRDVKPANVLICGDGRCVLTDFGVARMPSDSQLTTPGMVLGSPHFISPERAIGAPFGPPSDLFSLGVTLYTAVEGRPPFDRPDPIETMRAVVEEQPATAVRAGALANVLYGLLEKDPARRWDVPMSRRVLRDLLAGPLASNAPAHQTDPYAVVRPAPYTPPSAAASATGQIGGKAMLAPGESLTGAIRRRQSGTPAQRGPAESEAAQMPETGAFAAPAAAPKSPAGFHAAGGGGFSPGYATPGANPYATESGYSNEPTVYGVGPAYTASPHGSGGRHAAAQPAVPAPRGAQALATARATAAAASGRAVQTFRSLPPKGRMAVTAGAAAGVLLLAVLVGTVLLNGSGAGHKPAAKPTADATAPLVPSQKYTDKGISVSVPQAWTSSQGSTYVDYVEPGDSGRRLRINVENAGTQDAHQAAVAASHGLNNPARCRTPYREVAIKDVQQAGRPAAELEYTCGDGPDMRHGIWRFVVAGGKSYNFFLSVPDGKFKESKVIYDEMVRSFQFNA